LQHILPSILRRVDPDSVSLYPGGTRGQSMTYVCRTGNAVVLSYESARSSGESYFRLMFYRGSNDTQLYPALPATSEITTNSVTCGSSSVVADQTPFGIASDNRDELAHSYYDFSNSRYISSSGSILELVSNRSDPHRIVTSSLIPLRAGASCFATTRQADSNRVGVYCFNATSPSATLYQLEDLTPLYRTTANMTAMSLLAQTASSSYASVGPYLLIIEQNQTDLSAPLTNTMWSFGVTQTISAYLSFGLLG
jgi:hypothetical protein